MTSGYGDATPRRLWANQLDESESTIGRSVDRNGITAPAIQSKKKAPAVTGVGLGGRAANERALLSKLLFEGDERQLRQSRTSATGHRLAD